MAEITKSRSIKANKGKIDEPINASRNNGSKYQ